MARIWIKNIRIPVSRFVISGTLLMACITLFTLFTKHPIRALTGSPPFVVVIDAGHGGYDPGVKSGKIIEKELTLAVAKKLQSALEQRGIKGILTRETDTDFAEKGQRGRMAKREDLNKRMEIASQVNGQVFVSIHVNNSSLATRGGAEVFYNQTEGGKILGESIQKALHQIPGMTKRDSKPETYYLLKNLQIPAVIVEIGYLNIASERKKLATPEYQEKIAQGIATGIVEYFKGK